MIKKISFLVLIICLLVIGLSPLNAQASNGLTVLGSSVEVNFPGSISFKLSARSDVNVMDVRLHYAVERMKFAQVVSEVYLEFEPAASVEVKWVWDMRKTGGLPPGSSLEYWWSVRDAKNGSITTEHTRIQIEDRRYNWRSLTRGKVTLYWYEGDNAFIEKLMTATEQALSRLYGDTGAQLEKPVRIYVYGSYDDLRGSMIFPQEWTGGVAFTAYGIIAIGIAPKDLDWGVRAVAHELTHLVIHQMTFNPYGGLPTWLDEGLSMNAEGELSAGFVALLREAIKNNKLLSVRSISSPFSAFADESQLAYAQSYSVVKFLTEKYGSAKMFEMLNTFRQGSSYDEALLKVYGFDLDRLNVLWRDYVAAKTARVPEFWPNLPSELTLRGVLVPA